MRRTADAVVIGSGPNGLVAANALAEAGWDVIVVEAQPHLGGAVQSAEVTAPGFVTDLYSAFYPLAAASPMLRAMELNRFGLTWVQAPTVLAHPLADGRAALLHRDPERTAAHLSEFAPGDGEAWLELFHGWQRIRDDVLSALFTPFPPVAGGARLLRSAGLARALRLARLALTPVRRLAEEHFDGEGGRLILTGNAMHTDIPPDSAGSGVFGWLLSMLGQDVGFPVPRGGAGMLSRALVDRARAHGAELLTQARVSEVLVRSGSAWGVRLQDGTVLAARRAILADVPATTLYQDLLAPAVLPQRLRDDLRTFHWDHATLKLNWALEGPVPWRNPAASAAGTVHLGVGVDGFVDFAADLSTARLPRDPFVLFGQMAVADPTRAPAGKESAWAYTHLPQAVAHDPEAVARQVARVEAAVEAVAPGFTATVIARHVQRPHDLEDGNENLPLGALNGGTAALHQELIFRPTPGLGRAETPVPGLYLASASAHPGGGVHGACGWNAARAALGAHGPLGRVRTALARTAWERLLRE